MTFEQALTEAYNIEQSKNPEFKGLREEALRSAALTWNIIAVALNSGELLDDVVFINGTNQRISVPLTEKTEKKASSKKAKKENDIDVEKEKPTATI